MVALFRFQIINEGAGVRMFSKSGADYTTRLPKMTEAFAKLPAKSVILDGELGDKTLGVFLYASALGRQFSYEGATWGNGAFTKAMIEGLSGKADRENTGFVDTDELALYVRHRVLDMTTRRQEPVRIKPDAAPEMRIARLKP